MSKAVDDPILSALKKYERVPAQNDKKAILLMPECGYFLYGNRFCSITEYELEFYNQSLLFQGKSVSKPLFFSVLPGCFHVAGESEAKLVSLIFKISLEEDEPLRGILLAVEQEAELSLFSDAAIEALYRLSRQTSIRPNHIVPPDEALCQYAEAIRRNDLHLLASLYLRGRQLKSASSIGLFM